MPALNDAGAAVDGLESRSSSAGLKEQIDAFSNMAPVTIAVTIAVMIAQ